MMGQVAELLLAFVLAADGGAAGAVVTPPPTPDPAKQPAAAPLSLLPAIIGGTQSSPPETYTLRPAGDGTGAQLYDGTGFSARVARDGSVTFSETRVSMLKLLEPYLPLRGPRTVPSLFGTIKSLARNRGVPTADENAQTEDRYLLMPNTTRYRPDPREACRTCGRLLNPVFVYAGIRFDLTDELMRFNRQDPYRYNKAKFLAGTRDVRVRMAVKAHAENLKRALGDLPALLETIACDEGRSVAERRAVIEQLRKELDDTGASAEAHAATGTIDRFLSTRFEPEAAVSGCFGG